MYGHACTLRKERDAFLGIKGSSPSIGLLTHPPDLDRPRPRQQRRQNFSGKMMTSVISLLLVALASMAFFDVDVEARPSMLEVRSPLGGHEAEVDDALKYLVELDKYYSQVARPR